MHLACNDFPKICFSVKELADLELLSFIYVRQIFHTRVLITHTGVAPLRREKKTQPWGQVYCWDFYASLQ